MLFDQRPEIGVAEERFGFLSPFASSASLPELGCSSLGGRLRRSLHPWVLCIPFVSAALRLAEKATLYLRGKGLLTSTAFSFRWGHVPGASKATWGILTHRSRPRSAFRRRF